MPSSSSNIRWILIFWMFLVSAIGYLDRVNISIAGQSIAEEFHLSTVQLGYVFSAFVLGYALFQAPAGRLADRLGPRLVLGLGVVYWAIFTSLITFVSPSWGGLIPILLAIRFGLGVGEAVVYPASNCIVSQWIPSTERGIANGIIFCGVGFGAGVTSPLITYIMLNYGWRESFWASAVLGLVAGGIWYLIARDTPAQHPWVSPQERELIEAGLPQFDPKSHGPAKLSWAAILKNRDVLAITFSYFTYGYAAYIFFSWFFIYLSKVRGMNLRQSSYYTMLPFIAMAVCSLLGGWMSDRLTRKRGKRVGRCGLAAVAMIFCAIFIGVGTQVESVPFATVVLAGGAGALYIAQSSFWSISADIGKSSAGSVSGVMNMGSQLGGALTSSLTPAIANQFGWTTSFLVAAGLCVAGGLAWFAVRTEEDGEGVRRSTVIRDHAPDTA
jgi:ACS family glucarate transporter-like MFS transporter